MMDRLLKLILVFTFFFSYNLVSQENNYQRLKLGIDVIQDNDFEILKNKKIALLANFASRNSYGRETARILASGQNFKLEAVLTPEHGYYTNIPAGVFVDNDTLYGIPLISLYGNEKSPTSKILNKIDAIVIDIQDIGVRSYTYISTIFKTMQKAAESNIEVIILDRPNPIGGMIVDGNVLEARYKSFVGILPVSYIHGLTVGELATMINDEGWLDENETKFQKCKLNVVRMTGWERWMCWEDTGLAWYPTSPHVPAIESVRGIATLGIFGELGFISIGVGTTSPFQYIGDTSFDKWKLLKIQEETNLPGIELNTTKYRPFYGMNNGKDIWGFYLKFELNNEFRPFSSGIQIMYALRKAFPEKFNVDKIDAKSIEMFKKVTGTEQIFKAFFNGVSENELLKIANYQLNDYLKLRDKYLLYE